MKEKFKVFINRIPYKKLVLISIIVFLLGFFISIRYNAIFGAYVSFTGIFIAFILIMLYSLKFVIDDIEKFLGALLIVTWLLMSITFIGYLMLKYVPKFFPNKDNEKMMYELYTSSFTSLLAASVGIIGTYFGAIYGGRKSLEAVQKQIEKQENDEIKKEKENKEMVIRIITKFLKEEIINNKKQIEKTTEFYKYFNMGFNTRYGHGLKRYLKFDGYEKIKYELIKYTDIKLVEDVIDLYELLYLLVRYDTINELNEKEYNKLKTLSNKFQELIKYIDG
jgi:ABC-type multidrug transport system fused ATPase/permease subunit